MLLTPPFPRPATPQSAQWNDPGSSLQPAAFVSFSGAGASHLALCTMSNSKSTRTQEGKSLGKKELSFYSVLSPDNFKGSKYLRRLGTGGVPPAAVLVWAHPREGAGRLPRSPCSQPLFSRLLMSFQVGAPA